VDPTAPGALEEIRELTDGRGVEFAFEVAGRTEAMSFAYEATCRGGTTVFVGALSPSATLTFAANDLHATARRIVGTTYGAAQVRRDIPRLVAMAEAGELNIELMISERFPLEDANTALAVMDRGDVIRSVLIP
jgi:S-(hydroxymethyl)glutathione dehydrogenase/alcohol dehydrogenase